MLKLKQNCPLEVDETVIVQVQFQQTQLTLTIVTHTHTHPFSGHFSGITRVSRYKKGITNLDFTAARDIEWHWHQLGHVQVCTSLQTDNHAAQVFYRLDALPGAQPTVSKH